MKKTLIALMALASVAMGETLTWDFSAEGPFIGGTKGGSITTTDAVIDGIATKAMTGATGYWETNTTKLYDMLYGSATGGQVTFSMDIYWTGTSSNWETFVHVGQKECGITLGMSSAGQLTFANGNQYGQDVVAEAQLSANEWQTVAFTLSKGQTTITIGENVYTGNDIAWADMNWAAVESEGDKYKYSLGCGAPGWSGHYAMSNNVQIANMRVDYMVPEPATATLSLLALAGLAARRRRK